MAETVEMKPCPNPWCAKSDPALHRGGFRNRMVRVQCGTCGLHPPTVPTEFEAEAIAAWNRRAPPQPTVDAEEVAKTIMRLAFEENERAIDSAIGGQLWPWVQAMKAARAIIALFGGEHDR